MTSTTQSGLTDLTSPSSNNFYCVGINKDDTTHKTLIETNKIKSFLMLVPADVESGVPENVHGIEEVNTRRCMVDGSNPDLLTRELTSDIVNA